MKRLLISAAALTLLGAPAAFAQDNDHHDRGQHQGGGGQWQGRGGGGDGGGQQQGPQQQTPQQQTPQQTPRQQGGGDHDRGHSWQGRGANGGQAQSYQQQGGRQWNGSNNNRGQWQGRGADNRAQGQQRWQGGDRYRGGQRSGGRDWRSYHRNGWAQHRYRAPAYRWPGGYGYHRYGYGDFLPEIFFGQNYWISDYASYGLPYPPPGTTWVRYGPDALLIDEDSGEIVQVLYGVFY